jgi:pSer/pThr/pTyr-binding forkhead associated (FHA) protein
LTAILAFFLRLLLALSLYGFLGWALYTIWQQMRMNAFLISSRQVPTVSLTLIDTGTRRDFNNPEIILGREANCDLPVIDDTVSARHAALSYHHNQWWVDDLRSTNGTFLNGERVETSTVIIAGDELRVGRINFGIAFKN